VPHARSGSADDLTELLTVRPRHFLRAVPGRETFLWPEGPPDALVVKRTRGDLSRDRWYDRLRGHGVRSPGQREYENLSALAEAGVTVPVAVGWARGAGELSLVAMERVPHERTLRDEAGSPSPAGCPERLTALVQLVLRLHRAGWYHRDLYLQHFLIGADDRLVLIDVGRARCEKRPRRRWFVKDLAALLHSTPAEVPLRTRLRFLVDYLNGRGIHGRARRRRWARAVGTKARRLGAHRPRW